MATGEINDDKAVLISIKDGIATLSLNRPNQRNTLSRSMIDSLRAAFNAVETDATVRVIIVAAVGPVFCAGHDLKEVSANDSPEFYEQLFSECSALMMQILTLKKPVIAKVNGIATAAGCQLVATCDLAISSDLARFATPGVNIGLFCSTPMVALSRNVGRKQAMKMLLSGDMITASHAVNIGLINQAVPTETLDHAVESLALKIATKSPLTLAIGKEAFYKQLEYGVAEAYTYTSEVMTKNMMAHDAREGIGAFIEKRIPQWSGT